MKLSLRNLGQVEQINFLLTNRIPRRAATKLMGWVSRIENRPLTALGIKAWRLLGDDLHLQEAKQQHFKSLHDCFIRELKDGVRPIDAREHVLTSPCDALVGECGTVQNGQVFQAKGFPYELADLIPDPALRAPYLNGQYITLRLQSTMYHRFHAPLDCTVQRIDYLSGDTWNVNPIALKRIERLYARNERAVLPLHVKVGQVCMVPVAAILVASLRLHALKGEGDLRSYFQHRTGSHHRMPCQAQYAKGEEMGYFQHGSTILLFTTPEYQFCPGIETGQRLYMGQPLMFLPSSTHNDSTTP
jgi:phosphatidylserine decarboxylase